MSSYAKSPLSTCYVHIFDVRHYVTMQEKCAVMDANYMIDNQANGWMGGTNQNVCHTSHHINMFILNIFYVFVL